MRRNDRMKNTLTAALVGACLLLPMKAGAVTATKQDTLEVEGYWGGMFWEGNLKQAPSSQTIGGRVGYLFTDQWALEIGANWSPVKLDNVDRKIYWVPYHLDALYHFEVDEHWAPFIAFGAGAASGKSQDLKDQGFSLNWGLGLKYFFVNWFAFRGEARHVPIWSVFGEDTSNAELSVGLVLRFWEEPEPAYEPQIPRWKRPIPPPPPPVKCTPPPCAKPLDENGCPIDSDGDGVWDGCDLCDDTRPGSKVDEKGCAPVQRTWVLEGVNFEFDKATLTPQARKKLDEVIAVLLSDDLIELSIEISGHTDSMGTYQYNQKLSERRAKSVYNYFVANGVDGKRLVTKGYSESRPVATNQTREGRAKNRRVELKVLDEEAGGGSN